ncbi:hypothetical protein [Natrarchaeobius chitinivorans]|uniref:Uncharacterized protein n=1 Tax=Natrarchaeobius chitinivorans TaxID=1679083 RepID=A0A3N6LRM9_NATCH|nr:hypothetical protein [Natrarchaeobius chitinivorans]RQG92438.1 hypothetical protein EA473_16830 [Natrarchaeobius chitinivorans]
MSRDDDVARTGDDVELTHSSSGRAEPDTGVDQEDVIELCATVLTDPYVKARDLHINNEAALGERDWVGLTNFRDALDHVRKIHVYLDDDEPEKAFSEVVEMQGHIYRAAYDGAQTIPEAKIESVEANKLPNVLYTITLTSAPSDREYKRRKNQIREAISRGRRNKPENWKESVKAFEEAKQLSTTLDEEIPDKKDVYFRVVILLMGVIGAFSGLYTLASFL